MKYVKTGPFINILTRLSLLLDTTLQLFQKKLQYFLKQQSITPTRLAEADKGAGSLHGFRQLSAISPGTTVLWGGRVAWWVLLGFELLGTTPLNLVRTIHPQGHNATAAVQLSNGL